MSNQQDIFAREWYDLIVQNTDKKLQPLAEAIFSRLTAYKLLPVQSITNLEKAKVFYLRYSDSSVDEDGTKRLTLNMLSDDIKMHDIVLVDNEDVGVDLNNLDPRSEIGQAVIDECVAKITLFWLKSIAYLAKPEIVDFKVSEERYFADKVTKLSWDINRMCNSIARETRRGAGNWIVVSPIVLSLLQASNVSSFTTKRSDSESDSLYDLKHVGTLNSSIRVYCSLIVEENEILVGYTGSYTQYQPTDLPTCTDGGIIKGIHNIVVEDNELKINMGTSIDQDSEKYYRKIVVEGLDLV